MAEPPCPLDPEQTVDHLAEATPRPTAKGTATEVAHGSPTLSSSEAAQFRGYQIIGEIAKGGMGRVYSLAIYWVIRWRSLTLDERCAEFVAPPEAHSRGGLIFLS